MTNLQEANFGPDEALAERRARRRLLQGAPLAVGGVLALALLGAWVVPSIQRLLTDQQRLSSLESKVQRLPLLRAQLEQTIAQQEQAQAQERRLLGLIAGSGDIATFITQVDREASRAGVKLEELQPMAAAPAAAKGKPKPGARPKPKPGAADGEADVAAAKGCGDLARSGFTAQRHSLVVSGRYPQLLAFMRALENLSLLVVQCDLALEQPAQPPRAADAKKPEPIPPMQVRFALSLFEKGAAAVAPTAGRSN